MFETINQDEMNVKRPGMAQIVWQMKGGFRMKFGGSAGLKASQ